MKKYIVLAFAGLLSLSSCESFLDRSPLSDLSPSNYFKDKAEMKNWNAGIYDAFQSALSKRQVLFGDVRSDNVAGTTYEDKKIYMNALMSNISEASWEPFYTCISRCNVGIEKYPTIPNVLESEYAPYMAQCYAMRAYMYFWGTRAWGKLPIVTKSWDGSLDNIAIPRSSLEDVKKQILSDIEKAIGYFNLISDQTDKYYLNKDAMYALLTEVYMWYNDYQQALDASAHFVGHKSLALANGEIDWKNIFTNPSGSKEVIFAMAWNYETDGALSGWTQLLGASNTNNGYRMSEPIFDEFIDRLRSGEGTDARFWNTIDTVKIFYDAARVPLTYASYSAGVGSVNKCIKYSGIDPERVFDTDKLIYKSYFLVLNTTDSQFDLVMMRMANIMLLRAEALNKLGRGDEALTIVNDIRKRVGYLKDSKTEVSSVSNVNEVEKIILDERQLELWGEGYRWFDLMRTGHLVEVMDPIYSARQEASGVTITGFGDEGTKYWPIHYGEFESNKALVGDQNAPYTER